MKRAIKRKWVKALKSGHYKQVKGTLERRHNNGEVVGNCCLGVLCYVVGATRPGPQRSFVFPDGTKMVLNDTFGPTFDELGLTRDQCAELANMNDKQGKDFTEIGNWISRNL